MNSEIPILIFDSPDKMGKDTLIKELHIDTNYIYPCINRFTGTSFSYGKFWKRNDLPFEEYFKIDNSLFDKAILIYLDTPEELLKERFEEHNEKDIELKDLKKLKKHYEDYLSRTPLFTIKIDTSKPIEYCVKQIMEGINNFKNEEVHDKKKRLMKTIINNGDKIGNTREIRNIDFIIKDKNLDDEILTVHDCNVIKGEFPEYNEIYHSIFNKIRLKLEYFKNQDINSRQFIFNSDGCISLLHLMKRNDVLEVFATIRSCDVKKNFICDCYNLFEIASNLNDDFFHCEDIEVNIKINSAHLYNE